MKELLDGWGQIAARISKLAGVSISVAQAKRYEERAQDPLPVLRLGRYRRKRIAADPTKVEAWATREFASA